MAPKGSKAAVKKDEVKKEEVKKEVKEEEDKTKVTLPPMPKVGKDTNAAVLKKTTDAVHDIIKKHQMFPEPQRVMCTKILISKSNRKKRGVNTMYVHKSLVPNINKFGFDPLKAQDGFLIYIQDPEAIKELVAINQEMAEGTVGVYPTIHVNDVEYECLGGNHLTFSLRAFAEGLQSSISGSAIKPNPSDDRLKFVLEKGHRYWILDNKLTDEEKQVLSQWRNSDQDQSQGTSEAIASNLSEKNKLLLLYDDMLL